MPIDYQNAVAPNPGELISNKKKSPLDEVHSYHARMYPLWRFYADHYEGGPEYPAKWNPITLSTGTPGGQLKNQATKRYLWQYPQEPSDRYAHRMDRSIFVDAVAPVVDFYAATVGKQEYAVFEFEESDEVYKEFFGNCDLQGQDYLQFMSTARTHAATYGHSFIMCDMPRNEGEGITAAGNTEADFKAKGIRPYLIEITPPDMLNWKLDMQGRPTSMLFRVPLPEQGDVSEEVAPISNLDYELRYWNQSEWRIYRKIGDQQNAEWTLVAQGFHDLGRIPVVCLYHKRKRAWQSDSILKNSAKVACLLTNWASALDEAFENQMFAVPVLKSRETPSQVGVGVTTVMHLNPAEGEDFSYVSPQTQAFESSWSAFFRLYSMAMRMMGMGQASMISETPDNASGVAKGYDFIEAEKVMARMAHQEQEVGQELMDLIAAWTGKQFTGKIQYAEKFDLTSLQEDYQNLLLAQQANFPVEFTREFMKLIVKKQLPSLDEDVAEVILAAIENMEEMPSPQQVEAMFRDGAKNAPSAEPSVQTTEEPEPLVA
jgi:hypothetical protein